ncbi:MAG: 1-acyl-sn-glycerol-3-phosphate acyltransferase [Magnetococcales bacterium]|nr:1-acyl-sn-glycerol-3-phosphate acyltransferase [Magnetococcales bacterium]NGZ07693.1 1-acyl-sn-glycerol-3-phosphate acyltransferase [Magnetococcales bacterium]
MSVWQFVKGGVRSTLFFGLFVVGTVGFGLGISVLWPVVSLQQRRNWARNWSRSIRWVLGWSCQLHEQVEGWENLPAPPYVILSKHQSAWETVAFVSLFYPCVQVLKQSLTHIPVFGWALRATDQIAIDRSKGVAALHRLHEHGTRQLQEGVAVLIFPEGTRSAPGVTGKYHPGGVSLALAAGVPIVPVAHNAGSFWPRRSFLKKPGVIRVRIGTPLPTAGLSRADRKALMAQLEERIETMTRDLEQSQTASGG